MCAEGVLFVGRTKADMRPHQNQRGAPCFFARGLNGVVDRDQVVAVIDRLRVPAIGRKPQSAVFGKGELGRGGERDVVIVI